MTTSRTFPSRQFRLIALAVAAFGAAFAFAASAHATVYCVDNPSCPAGGVPEATVDAAVLAANVAADHDSLRIGAGTFPAPTAVSQPLDISGAGEGATELDLDATLGSGLYLENAQSQVTDLTVRLAASNQNGIRLLDGADAQRVAVVGSHALKTVTGIVAEDPGTDLRSITIDLGDDLGTEGISDGGNSRISDSDITAGLGIVPSHAGTFARRIVVRSTVPLYVFGGILNVADALLVPYPEDPTSQWFDAAEVYNGNANEDALLFATGLTIVGNGKGIGIDVASNTSVNAGTAGAHVSGAVITGVGTDIVRNGKSASETANVAIDHSAFDSSKVNTVAGNGVFQAGPGNLTGGADPKFLDPAAGDYRPRFDSPLLDTGSPVEALAGDDDTDLGGRARVRDSDGNGSEVRDIGAYEYQRLAPNADFSTTSGTPTTFDAAKTSDPDGDPLAFSWAFGDGASAATVATSHLFAAPGSYLTTLTATDATGLSASASTTVQVTGPGGAGGGGGSSSAPVLSKLSRSIARRHGRAIGSVFKFQIDQNANVRFVFAKKHHRAGALKFTAHAGANKLRFLGRISKKKTLRPGRYTVTVIATNAAGLKSKPRTLHFRVAR